MGVVYEPGELVDVPESKVQQLIDSDRIALPGQEDITEVVTEVAIDGDEL